MGHLEAVFRNLHFTTFVGVQNRTGRWARATLEGFLMNNFGAKGDPWKPAMGPKRASKVHPTGPTILPTNPFSKGAAEGVSPPARPWDEILLIGHFRVFICIVKMHYWNISFSYVSPFHKFLCFIRFFFHTFLVFIRFCVHTFLFSYVYLSHTLLVFIRF